MVELDTNGQSAPILASVEPASGTEELFSDITFSELAYEEPVKESFIDSLKAKLPLLGNKEEKIAPVETEATPEQQSAIVPAPVAGKKQIAIVIDDAGVDKLSTKHVIELTSPLTISFLTYATKLNEQVGSAKRAGHEIMAHVPMEPFNQALNPGPNYLRVEDTDEEIRNNFRQN